MRNKGVLRWKTSDRNVPRVSSWDLSPDPKIEILTKCSNVREIESGVTSPRMEMTSAVVILFFPVSARPITCVSNFPNLLHVSPLKRSLTLLNGWRWDSVLYSLQRRATSKSINPILGCCLIPNIKLRCRARRRQHGHKNHFCFPEADAGVATVFAENTNCSFVTNITWTPPYLSLAVRVWK